MSLFDQYKYSIASIVLLVTALSLFYYGTQNAVNTKLNWSGSVAVV